MSYILDALKKADSERERGSVPGLHSQPLGQVDDEDNGSARSSLSPAVWVGAGVGLCLIGLLTWQLWMRPGASPASPPATVEPVAPPPGTMPPAVAPMATQPPQVTQAVPYPPPPAREPTAPPATPRPAEPSDRRATGTAAVPTAVSTPSPASPSTTARVLSIAELPEDIRRDLPPLVIGGAMYSETPASRMLIVNSQVFHEGDQPYQGLILEEIRLKSAVFRYRGYRYAVNY
jgi:general secretion pathway protein B